MYMTGIKHYKNTPLNFAEFSNCSKAIVKIKM